MNRSKDKGTKFETAVVRYLRAMTGDQQIDRMALHGTDDEGDIEGVKFHGRDVVIECKDTRQLNLTEHLREALKEAQNHTATGHKTQCGVLVQHAPGIGTRRMGEQWVVMRLQDFANILIEANDAMKAKQND